MSSNAHVFAVTVLAGFKSADLHTDDEIVRAGGPSTTTLTKLRNVAEKGATMRPPRGDTLRKIDTAAEWAAGSARALWLTSEAPRPRRPRLSEATGRAGADQVGAKPDRRRVMDPYSIEGFVEQLAERVLELEERLDVIEQERDLTDAPNLSAVAKKGSIEPAGEFE